MNTCSNCKYYKQSDAPIYSRCRRRNIFVPRMETDWCGEYEQRDDCNENLDREKRDLIMSVQDIPKTPPQDDIISELKGVGDDLLLQRKFAANAVVNKAIKQMECFLGHTPTPPPRPSPTALRRVILIKVLYLKLGLISILIM